MTTLTATPTKLRNGSWGARVAGTVHEGDIVTITTRSGKSWQAEVVRVVWTDGSVAITATRSLDRPAPRSSNRMGSGHGRAAAVPGYSSYCTDTPNCGCYDCAS